MWDCMSPAVARTTRTHLLKQQGVTHLLLVIVTEGTASNHHLGEGDKLQLLKTEFFMSAESF